MNEQQPAAEPDIADIIAGELKVSRGTAYDLMREALRQTAHDTRPQKAAWVGLTDEERMVVINSNASTGLWHMAKAIESKLREKNGLQPAARVNLTIDELIDLEGKHRSHKDLSAAIKAKLREKNGGA